MDRHRAARASLERAGRRDAGLGALAGPQGARPLGLDARTRLAVVAALGWGALAASSLVFGALLGLARPWRRKTIGLVLGFGAGALISAVSFELAEEGVKLAGALPVAIGLTVGAITYYLASIRVASLGGGAALALGA